MNREQFSQFWAELRQPLQAQWGKLTDDDLRTIAGDQGRFTTAIGTRYGDRQGEVVRWTNRRYACWIGNYSGYEEERSAAGAKG